VPTVLRVRRPRTARDSDSDCGSDSDSDDHCNQDGDHSSGGGGGSGRGGELEFEAVVTPISVACEHKLRTFEWQHACRLRVEKQGAGRIGYLHMCAMSGANMSEFAEGFYPVFEREGLVLDMRHNRGGNIDR
jgi:hypothetical protein